MTVECYLWAYNIEQRHRYSLDFQIMTGKTREKTYWQFTISNNSFV